MKCSFSFALLVALAALAKAQADPTSRSWNKPVPPFRIVGNLYYVGAIEIGSFLITTRKGHILLDGGFVETAPQIEQNVAQLGFKLEDVKILLNSHAHFDHAGGLAELKQKTGAKLIASERDAELLRNGGHGDFRFGDTLPFPPVQVDQIIGDGEPIQLGPVTPRATRLGRRKFLMAQNLTTSCSRGARQRSIINWSGKKAIPASRQILKRLLPF